MRFGECYEHLERGMFISKKGWVDSFLWLKKKAIVKSDWCKDPILKAITDANGGAVEAEQTICKYDGVLKKVITGFVPQQEDMASDDWYVANPKILDTGKNKSDYVGDLFEGVDMIKKP